MTDRLFVYGTLKRGSGHPFAEQLEARATYTGEARYNGRLYRVAHYPGVVASSSPDEWVFGDVYDLHDADFLAVLDRYEGCGPDDPEPTQYLRLLQAVTFTDGASVEAWVYVFNRPVDALQRIMSGRFGEAEG